MKCNMHFIKNTLPDATCLQGTIPDDIRISIDSRTIIKGDVFVALSGSTHDGHNFIHHAIKQGAVGCIVAKEKAEIVKNLVGNSLFILAVTNPYEALLELARAWRAQFKGTVIGVTGSVGKTSTKELLGAMLKEAQIPSIVSDGNQNTALGIALNIFKLRSHHQIAVFEMGINERGEMNMLADLVRPTSGVITKIAHAHLAGLGSLTDIAHEKRLIFKYFNESHIGIINGDQPVIAHSAYSHPIIKFGFKTTNHIQARKISLNAAGITFTLKIYHQKHIVFTRLIPKEAIINILAATAAAHLLGIPTTAILAGIRNMPQVPERFQYIKLRQGTTLINDAYNANPESMKAALNAFEQIQTSVRKIIVLGDMKELGIQEVFWHRQLGKLLTHMTHIHRVILVGELVQWTKKIAGRAVHIDVFPHWQDALRVVEEEIQTAPSFILLKGSRSTQVRFIAHALQQ